MFCLEGVAQGTVEVDDVVVRAAFLYDLQVAGVAELVHDAVHGPLTDTYPTCHLRQPNVGLLGDADEDVRVVREERPARFRLCNLVSCHLKHANRVMFQVGSWSTAGEVSCGLRPEVREKFV